VRVAPGEVTIRNCVDDDGWSYWFICPSCRLRAAARTRRGSAFDAIYAGSTLDTWRLPAELDERPAGPPLTFIDFLELRLLLLEPDWIDQLT
jgi:hypothetical protein